MVDIRHIATHRIGLVVPARGDRLAGDDDFLDCSGALHQQINEVPSPTFTSATTVLVCELPRTAVTA